MSKIRRLALSMLLGSATGLVLAAPQAGAETLQDALAAAYRDNPTLTGARAGQRATDEQVNIARARGRPSADAQVSYQRNLYQTFTISSADSQFTAQGGVQVPLYSGGQIRNAVNAAKLRAEAGRGDLRGTEATVFSRVVAAYMDVIRDSAVVSLNGQNVHSLQVNLQASRDRFSVGDLTRTDVAQSESRLALAVANLEQAQAQLITSKENYIALVGSPAGDLQPPPPLPGLPTSPDAAVSIALADNPDIQAANKARDAARYDVRSTEGRILPTLSGFANGTNAHSYGYRGTIFGLNATNQSVAVGASITVPIYQGGGPAAAQRQAVAQEGVAIEREIETERGVISQVRASYASWQASLKTIDSTEQAVKAAELSLEGVKAENSVGARTILDILNAEQEALNARVQLVTARRNAYVAAFTLIAALGHGQAEDLGLDPATRYDPMANDKRVRGKFLDFDFDRRPTAVSTSTRATPSQDARSINLPTP